jgi:hypothetical protein
MVRKNYHGILYLNTSDEFIWAISMTHSVRASELKIYLK